MAQRFIFGMGYTGKRVAAAMAVRGWRVEGTGSAGTIAFDDSASVRRALRESSHVLSSVPPGEAGEPVLEAYGDAFAAGWIGYLSSTGVYGDTGGAWVDESAPAGTGRRNARAEADTRWQTQGAHVFRLPGIYGPGRSAFERVESGRAHRIDLPGQVFSRVHVDDIVSGVLASFAAPAGVWNLADDLPCSQNAVIEHACRLLGRAPPPLLSLDEAGLSPMARGFYAENRRVANGRAKRLLGWRPAYPTYREGLAAILTSRRPPE